MRFWTKSKNTTTTKQKLKHKNPCRSRELNPGPLAPTADAITTAPPSQLSVSFLVKLFNCFDAISQSVNKQRRICGPHIFKKFIFFCNIFKCMNNYIWHYLLLTKVGFTA